MKYIMEGFWIVFLFFAYLFAFVAQFLWNFKKPTVTLEKTIDAGMEYLDDWKKNNPSDRPERDL